MVNCFAEQSRVDEGLGHERPLASILAAAMRPEPRSDSNWYHADI